MNNCRILSKEEAEYWSDKIFSINPGYILRDKFGLPEIYNPNSISRKNINKIIYFVVIYINSVV